MNAVEKGKASLQGFLSFVKTFDEREFATIYCEREWRATKQFDFTLEDVAMIVLPKSTGNSAYFARFVAEKVPRLLPQSIPVVPWEDLIEH